LTQQEGQGYLDDMTIPQRAVPGGRRMTNLFCSFCFKDKDSVGKLVAGHGVYICNECVALCGQIIAGQPAGDFGAWYEKPDDELLAMLARIQTVVTQVDAAVHDYVETLRGKGISWTRIGEALGVSKQAAWERFSGED
jgi:hypothetical protein